MDEPLMDELPMTELPMTELPMTELPMTELPMTELPMTELPMTELPMGELPMGESLVDKAHRLREVAGEAIATRDALRDAQRLGKRSEELRAAMAAPASAKLTWEACVGADVPNLQAPDDAGLSPAVADVQRRLDAEDLPPDSAFDVLKHGLAAFAHHIDEAVAQAWQPFARSKAASAGFASVQVLPPATRQSLSRTVTEIERAVAAPPAGRAQVDAFARNLAILEREVDQARVRDLPAQLKLVFDQLGDAGFPLSELTAEQLRLLQENGLADDLVLRWAV